MYADFEADNEKKTLVQVIKQLVLIKKTQYSMVIV